MNNVDPYVFQKALEYSNEGFALIDIDSKIVWSNKNWCEIFEYPRDEMNTKTISDISDPGTMDVTRELTRGLLSGAIRNINLEKRYVTKSGRKIWCKVKSSLIRDENGNPFYFFVHMQDITFLYDKKQIIKNEVDALIKYLEKHEE